LLVKSTTRVEYGLTEDLDSTFCKIINRYSEVNELL